MDLPKHIVQSQLYSRIHEDQELFSALFSMRSIVLSLAETTGRTVPDFTDHTVRHMDALWFVAEQILTPAEIDNLTPAEAFLIGAAFYLHDIGMAYAATKEGIISIKSSPAYRAVMVQGRSAKIPMLEARALGIAIRAMHADAAKELATNEIPGSAGRYLFEALSFREAWGSTCGELASSHHWTLSRLEDQLGPQCDAPLPGNRTGDLLYVAACLRLIDYAHINRDRAPSIDRTFRGDINDASLIHW